MLCPSCQKEIQPGKKFCRFCGASLSQIQTAPVQNQQNYGNVTQSTANHSQLSAAQQVGLTPPPGKKPTGLIIALIVTGSVLLLVLTAGILFLIFGLRGGLFVKTAPTQTVVMETGSSHIKTDPVETQALPPETKDFPYTSTPEATELPVTDVQPTEPEYVFHNMIQDLTDRQLYELNVFLSNFSEIQMAYYEDGISTGYDAVNFAFLHTIVNNYKAIVFDGSWMKISADTIEQYTNRFLGVVPPRQTYGGYYEYVDGYYRVPAASGETYNHFTIANTVYENPNGTFTVYYDVYQLDYEVYFDKGMPDAVYHLRTANGSSYALTYEGSGSATIRPYTLSNGRESYQLIFYEIY